MVNWVLQKLLGTYHDREVKRLRPVVARINALEPAIQQLTDGELRAKTDEFRRRIADGMKGASFPDPSTAAWYELTADQRQDVKKQRRAYQQRVLDAILPEAFAVVRETSRRVLNMRHFDMQLVGGMMLHEGKIAEMATGEGKTLVATLPAYLNALTGRGVHVVTVNDYLARRDARWMGPVYHALGLSVGSIQGVDPAERRQGDESLSFLFDPSHADASDRFVHLRPCTRQESYRADITYGQNNEFGFDYLRDNMRFRLGDLTQGEYHFAIVDEVDSILIDEARTPLIISGPAEESTDLYYKLDKVVHKLKDASHFELDEKQHSVNLTDEGIKACEELLGVANLYDEQHMRLVHHINQALRAHHLFKRDVEYMVKDDEIIIVDEFTGRLMPGRRWSDGLHQAVEAKEGVRIRQENQTLATVTFQNYFRMYEKLAGMTGTAATEAQEFKEIYNLDVVMVPTNRVLIRTNHPDVVYKTEDEKYLAVVQEIVDLHRAGRPVLIGTISIDKSERLSRMLKEPGPVVRRLGLVCEWTAADVKKEQALDAGLRQAIEQVLSRPAMVSETQVSEALIRLKTAAPKSNLVYRLEQLLSLARTAAAVKAGLPHSVLNAKYHEHEARIVAQAGRKGALTIATNMAGRGTDILLGGNPQAMADDAIREEETRRQAPLEAAERQAIAEKFNAACAREHHEVVAAGGLHVLGTERHEARRIDNQLRGRSGRQGDPGSSRFYLSLQDDLMRIFGSERIAKLMELKWFQWEEGLPIEHTMVSRSIETAQRRVEGQNFDARKHLLEYDNTMNRQREVIYEQRRRILEGIDLQGMVRDIIAELSDGMADTYAPRQQSQDAWDLDGLRNALKQEFGVEPPADLAGTREQLAAAVQERFEQVYEAKRQQVGAELMGQLERHVLLSIIDAKWKDHLYLMDALRDGIGLRAYGQRDPIVEYQREGYRMFQDMIASIKLESLTMLLRVQPVAQAAPVSVFEQTPQHAVHPEVQERFAAPPIAEPMSVPDALSAPPAPAPRRAAPAPQTSSVPKAGRNDPCPCGSGKKYKKCHGG